MKKKISIKIPSNLNSYSEYEDYYRKLNMDLLILIGLPICVIFCIYNVFISQYITSIFVFFMCFLLSFYLFDSLKNRESSAVYLRQEIFTRLFMILLILYLMYAVGYQKSLSQTPWFLVIPVLLFYSTNNKEIL